MPKPLGVALRDPGQFGEGFGPCRVNYLEDQRFFLRRLRQAFAAPVALRRNYRETVGCRARQSASERQNRVRANVGLSSFGMSQFLSGNGEPACRRKLCMYNASMTGSQDDSHLQSDAKSLSERISKLGNDDKLPLIVEFAGSPKAGKSTTIDIVVHFFKRTGFKTWAPTEGASKRTPPFLRSDLVAFNAWALNYAISEILTSYHNVEKYDLVVLDRGPFDSLAWMRVLKDNGELTQREYEYIENFARHPKWSKLVERIYLFTCIPATSMKREHESKLIQRDGTAMNEEMLTKLKDKYLRLEEDFQKDELSIQTFSTDQDGDPRDNARRIVNDIIDMLRKRVQ